MTRGESSAFLASTADQTRRRPPRTAAVPAVRSPDRPQRTDDQDPQRAAAYALRVAAAGDAPLASSRRAPNRRSQRRRRQLGAKDRPVASITARVVEASGAQGRPAAAVGRPSGSGTKRLDPEVLVAHLDHLFRAAWALCGSRESAEDLVQETVARILARPRLLRAGGERAYLMRTLRNTFLMSRRSAARRPHVVTTITELDAADLRTGARPEDAVIAAQVFSAIARLPEPFRLALVAVDVAGLSYREAARALGAPEATITTRLYRARQRVARELDPERFEAAAIEEHPR
jgi:RNA polymerase sigma-70 factor, ECF subfamily